LHLIHCSSSCLVQTAGIVRLTDSYFLVAVPADVGVAPLFLHTSLILCLDACFM